MRKAKCSFLLCFPFSMGLIDDVRNDSGIFVLSGKNTLDKIFQFFFNLLFFKYYECFPQIPT